MLQLFIQGILIGSVYGLSALGITLIFGVMRVTNFAHGQLLMVAMFLGYTCVTVLGMNVYLSLIIVAPAMFIIGYFINKILVQPVLKKESDVREPIGALVLTFGLGVVLENVFLAIYGPNYNSITTTFGSDTVNVGSLIFTLPRLYAFLISAIVTALFYVFLKKTEMGRQIRAVGQDRNAALLMGINVNRIYCIAFGLGLAILSTCAVALLPFYNVHPSIGGIFGTKAFVTIMLGGLGSIPGAIIGGLLIGVVESLATMFVPNTLASMVVLYAFLVFLFFRPTGLFGSKHDV